MAISTEYNGFGLEYTDIINSFKDAVEDDFASNGECGRYSIEREIEFQEQRLASNLNATTLDLLEQLPWHFVDTTETVDVSGYTTFYFDFTPDFTQDIMVYVFEDFYSDIESQNTLGCSKNARECGSFQLAPDSTSLEQAVTYVQDSDGNWYGNLNRVIGENDKVAISYSIDKSNMEIASLKGFLRDMVCCILGNGLYADGDDVWKLVEKYCEHATMALQMVGGKRWIPAEFKRLDFVNPVLPTGIKSVPIHRN